MLATKRGSQGSGSPVARRLWQVTALGAGALAAAAVRGAAGLVWRRARHDDPPAHPTAKGVGLGEALVWGVALAVGAAVAKVLAERVAAAGWEKAVGSPPPDPTA
jgi:hypothetical protein